MHFFLMGGEALYQSEPFDLFCAFIAAVIHDFMHPGTNNMYSVRTYDEHAIVYNDNSVLENYHLSEAFRVFKVT